MLRSLECWRRWVLFNFTWATDMRVRAVTPLAVLLRLGSRPTHPSSKRPVRLLSWLGFNALIGSTGTLNYSWEVYSKPIWPTCSAYASRYKLCRPGCRFPLHFWVARSATLDWCPPGVLVGIVHLRVPEPHTAGLSQGIGATGLRSEGDAAYPE